MDICFGRLTPRPAGFVSVFESMQSSAGRRLRCVEISNQDLVRKHGSRGNLVIILGF